MCLPFPIFFSFSFPFVLEAPRKVRGNNKKCKGHVSCAAYWWGRVDQEEDSFVCASAMCAMMVHFFP